jgi:hypothetical protein
MAKVSNETNLVHILFNERIQKRIAELGRVNTNNSSDIRSKIYGLTEAQEVLAGIIHEIERK